MSRETKIQKPKAKKSLGQNFLKDKAILKKIADFALIGKGDPVVEIGPGEGGLTEFLLERAQKVIAVEKDEELAENLKGKFKNQIESGKLEIIVGDILKLSLEKPEESPPNEPCERDWREHEEFSSRKISVRERRSFLSASSYKLVGNIPYYITGALFKKFLECENQPKSITFVVQKEVADRIVARDGKESILSISIKAYGEPKYGGTIKAGSFYPKPKVDSAIIAMREISRKKFKQAPPPNPLPLGEGAGREAVLLLEQKFFQILKSGFAHRRKLLIKNLGSTKEAFEKCNVPEKARAENLKLENWMCLTKEL